ncbi:tonB-system energizer ExbB [Ancylobacter terrae]|uniref:tonB-system energizer ExbB n=1 Tax=Ancylobacter sp. sgz301288 TaxID=3342077 RepID=UPI00385E5298
MPRRFSRSTTRLARLAALLLGLAIAVPAGAQEVPAPQAPVARVEPAAAPLPASAADQPGAVGMDARDGAGAGDIAALLPHDLSPWGMFLAADRVVKAVMIGLALASVLTWTIWIAKTLELWFAVGRLRRALRVLLASVGLAQARTAAQRAGGPAAAMLGATELELERSAGLPAEGIKERVAIALARIEAGAGRRMTRGTGQLATIGATAPFVGLFGTVWGIMNSFIGISKAQTTNLAVVAPGIAEALLATAIGLVAAIPAVVIYNHFSRQVSGYRALLGDASAETLRLLSRDLDRAASDHVRPRGAHLRAAAE